MTGPPGGSSLRPCFDAEAEPQLIDDSAWQKVGTGATTIEPGTLTITGTGTSGTALHQNFTSIIGRKYRLTQTISGVEAALAVGNVRGGGEVVANRTVPLGTSSIEFVASATSTWFRYQRTGTGTCTITDYALDLLPAEITNEPQPNLISDTAWTTGGGAGGAGITPAPAGALSILSYGAVGDGATDCQTAMQNCFNAAKAQNKAVLIPAGTFAHSGMLTADSIKIYGMGETSVIHALDTVNNGAIMLTGANAAIEGVKITGVWSVRNSNIKTASILVRACDGFTIKNIWVLGAPTGSNTSISGIFVYGGRNGYIGYNTIRGTRNDSIHMTVGKTLNGASTYNSDTILVERNHISYSNDDGIACVSGTGTSGVVVSNVTARYNTVVNQYGGRGITVVGSNGCLYHDNYVEGGTNGRAGVMIASESNYNAGSNRNFTLRNNTIKAAGGTGTGHGAIHIFNSYASTATSNVIDGIIIEGNDVYQAKKDGLVINGSGIIRNVTIKDTKFFAPASGSGVVKVSTATNITQTNNSILPASSYTGDKVPSSVGSGAGTSGSGASATAINGLITLTSTGTSVFVRQSFATSVGGKYILKANVADGSAVLKVGASAGSGTPIPVGIGAYSTQITATSTETHVEFSRADAGKSSISGIIVQQVVDTGTPTQPSPNLTWTKGGPGTLTVVPPNAITLGSTGGSATTATTAFNVVSGKRYRVDFSVADFAVEVLMGTSAGGTQYKAVTNSVPGNHWFEFVAAGSATSIAGRVLNVFNNFTNPDKTIWVATTGSDTTGDGSSGKPYASIQKAINNATAGTAIKVKAGTYNGSININTKYGTAAKPITLESVDGKWQAVINGGNDAAIEAFKWKYLMIKGFDIICNYTGTDDLGGCKMHGDVNDACEYLYFVQNRIRGKGQDGFKLFAGSKNCLVLGNTIEGNWLAETIDFVQVEQTVVAYNTLTATHGRNTLTMKAGSRRIEVVGNIFGGEGGGVRVGGAGSSRLNRTFPEYWEGWSEGYPDGFEAFRIHVHHNVMQNTTGTSLSFIGSIESVVENNYLTRSVNCDKWEVEGEYTHNSQKNTFRNNIWATTGLTFNVAAGQGSGNVVSGNVVGTNTLQAGAVDAYVDSFIADQQGSGQAFLQFRQTLVGTPKITRVQLTEPGVSTPTPPPNPTPVDPTPTDPTPNPGTKVYPTVRGYATDLSVNPGGIGQPYYYVNRWDDANEQGTFRHALNAGPRLIIFEVGGRFPYGSGLGIPSGRQFVSIAGETAPSPGVTLQGISGKFSNFAVRGSLFHISHIAIERGHSNDASSINNGDGIEINTSGKNLTYGWFDHCLTAFGMDEGVQLYHTLSNTDDAKYFSFTNCIFTDPLNYPPNYDPQYKPNKASPSTQYPNGSPHGYNMLIGEKSEFIDVQHCLFGNALHRNPRIGGRTRTLIANNIILNWGRAGITFESDNLSNYDTFSTLIGNIGIGGPNRGDWPYLISHWTSNATSGTMLTLNSQIYLEGNSVITTYSKNPCTATFGHKRKRAGFELATTPPLTVPDMRTIPQSELLEMMETNCGPRPKDRNNSVALRAIDQLKKRGQNAKIIDHELQVGGKSTSTQCPNVSRPIKGTNLAPPTDHNNKEAVWNWLKSFKQAVQYDEPGSASS